MIRSPPGLGGGLAAAPLGIGGESLRVEDEELVGASKAQEIARHDVHLGPILCHRVPLESRLARRERELHPLRRNREVVWRRQRGGSAFGPATEVDQIRDQIGMKTRDLSLDVAERVPYEEKRGAVIGMRVRPMGDEDERGPEVQDQASQLVLEIGDIVLGIANEGIRGRRTVGRRERRPIVGCAIDLVETADRTQASVGEPEEDDLIAPDAEGRQATDRFPLALLRIPAIVISARVRAVRLACDAGSEPVSAGHEDDAHTAAPLDDAPDQAGGAEHLVVGVRCEDQHPRAASPQPLQGGGLRHYAKDRRARQDDRGDNNDRHAPDGSASHVSPDVVPMTPRDQAPCSSGTHSRGAKRLVGCWVGIAGAQCRRYGRCDRKRT